jgi:glycosyltransferase involved in cell wall biosynthesis
MPRFTIGMPTYNRCDLLANALRAAVGQTYPELEILVCDNASTDRTPEVVRSSGDRVRYHRSATNIGMWLNFAKTVELAEVEYFSWLQDDDLIHRDFVRRALETFAQLRIACICSTGQRLAPATGGQFRRRRAISGI